MIDVTMTAWPNHPKRIGYFRQTIEALKENLTASSHNLRYFCSAETQRDPDYSWHGNELTQLCQMHDVSLSWREGAANLGNNMNAALRLCTADLILLVQDDYLLLKPLNLSLGATLLETTPSLDLVRYAWPPGVNRITGQPRCLLRDHSDGWRRAVDGRIYGDDPHLRRRSFMNRFGWYLENAAHALSEGNYYLRLLALKANVAVADCPYFGHLGRVPAVMNDRRKHLRENAFKEDLECKRLT